MLQKTAFAMRENEECDNATKKSCQDERWPVIWKMLTEQHSSVNFVSSSCCRAVRSLSYEYTNTLKYSLWLR